MADPDKTTCEVCGGSLERLISRTAFALKGGGWYKDLYASPKPEGGGDKAAKSEPASTGTSESSAPAAPAASTGSSTSSTPAPSGGSGGGTSGGGGGGSLLAKAS
jgi:predicted nucleic acid-binding Zn ribbon protein